MPLACAIWPESDSTDISYIRTLEKSRSLSLARSESILSYSGSALWTQTTDIETDDTVLYALNVNGLQVFDMSDVSQLVLMSEIMLEFGSEYGHLCRSGGHLYVGRSDRVIVLDLTDPWEPVLVATIVLEGMIMEIEVIDDRAYFGIARAYRQYGTGYPSLYIYDVSDPSSPISVGKYQSSSQYKDARRFEVVGDYIYAINTWNERLEVISIVDDTRPLHVGNVYLEGWARDVVHNLGYLYVANGTQLDVYNLTNPDQPSLHNSYPDQPIVALGFDGTVMYEVYGGDPEVHMYNISSPGGFSWCGYYKSRCHNYTVHVADQKIFIAETTFGFSIADASGYGLRPRIGEFTHECSTLMGIDVAGDYAYLCNYMSYFCGDNMQDLNGIYVVDITDKHNPEFIYYVNSSGNTSDVCIHDTLLFLSQAPRTSIYSIADPINPVYLSRYLPNETRYTSAASARDTVMYVSCQGQGFETGSIADPVNPYCLDGIDFPDGMVMNSVLNGNIAYVIDWVMSFDSPTEEMRLQTVDVTDPSNIQWLNDLLLHTFYFNFSYSYEIDYRGAYLYFTAGQLGLQIIDISNPIAPDLIGYVGEDDELFSAMLLKQNYLIASVDNSLRVYNLDEPAHPELVQFIPMSSLTFRMALLDEYLHVATENGYYCFHVNLITPECGDANASGGVDIDDVVFLISYIFAGGIAPDPIDVADVNCSGGVDIDDVVYLIMYIFAGGPGPCDEC